MEHYDMLNITMIEQLLNDKWETFIKKRFYQRMIFSIIHLIFLSIAVYAREPDSPNVAIFPTTNATTIV
jgi:transient receptor potential cation channel subfamily V protein 6